jgi:hypothetical protein
MAGMVAALMLCSAAVLVVEQEEGGGGDRAAAPRGRLTRRSALKVVLSRELPRRRPRALRARGSGRPDGYS